MSNTTVLLFKVYMNNRTVDVNIISFVLLHIFIFPTLTVGDIFAIRSETPQLFKYNTDFKISQLNNILYF